MSEIENLAQTIARLARPDMKPKQLIEAVREEHPKASKKDIVRAAFYAVIVSADDDPMRTHRLHEFALQQRREPGRVNEAEPAPRKLKVRKKKASNDEA